MKTRFAFSVLLSVAASVFFAGDAQAQAPTVEAEVATAIVDRMPDGTGTQFPADVGQLYVWSRVTGARGTSITHVWIHGDTQYPIVLEIRGSPWRTWSSKTITPDMAGEWQVEIHDQEGTVLQTLNFTVG